MNKVERDWGHYTVLHQDSDYVVKRLVFKPSGVMSNQRHSGRAEHWFLAKGELVFNGKIKEAPCSFDVSLGTWHRAENISDKDTEVIEIWTGPLLDESDIERD